MQETIIFKLGKVFWALFAPSHFLFLLLLSTFVFSMSQTLKNVLRAFVLSVFFIAFLLPVGDWALVPLESCTADRAFPMPVNGVIILGGAMDADITEARKTPELNSAADRIFALMRLKRLYPQAKFVYSGGSGSLKRPTFQEADQVKILLEDAGWDTKDMVFDSHSRNTHEDVLFTKPYFSAIPNQNWLLVTSAWHMPRALSLFESAGKANDIHFFPYAVDYATYGKITLDTSFNLMGNLDKFDRAVKEYIGLIMNRLLDRTTRIWPCGEEKKSTLQ
jgi:uncharacterized SAM-binding protein YcdF (DUF218 family)